MLAALDREAQRIGWPAMLIRGNLRAIRNSASGRLLAVVERIGAGEPCYVAIAARFLHLALGYPVVRPYPLYPVPSIP